jgi:hypothetical protein
MKRYLISILIVLAVIVFVGVILFTKLSPHPDGNIAKCIGQKSVLYTQLGCHACKIQEDMFGENYQYLNVVDCFYEREKCGEIEATPTWVIEEQKYRGVQSIETLKELTGCLE